jgi:hypothetical protein
VSRSSCRDESGGWRPRVWMLPHHGTRGTRRRSLEHARQAPFEPRQRLKPCQHPLRKAPGCNRVPARRSLSFFSSSRDPRTPSSGCVSSDVAARIATHMPPRLLDVRSYKRNGLRPARDVFRFLGTRRDVDSFAGVEKFPATRNVRMSTSKRGRPYLSRRSTVGRRRKAVPCPHKRRRNRRNSMPSSRSAVREHGWPQWLEK